MRQLQQKWPCFYSIIRYVPHPLRNEARNIGVIVLCPDHHYGGVRLRPDRTGVPLESPNFRFLHALMGDFPRVLPGYYAASPDVEWTHEYLDTLSRESTNVVQYTAPAAAVSDPVSLLDTLYREFVLPPTGTPEERKSRAVMHVMIALRHALEPSDRSGWVQPRPKVVVEGAAYRFDVGIEGRDRLYYTVDALAFRRASLQQCERRGAWYSCMWKQVADETGATGIVLIDKPTQPGPVLDHYQRVAEWIRSGGAEVREASEVGIVAGEIAAALG